MEVDAKRREDLLFHAEPVTKGVKYVLSAMEVDLIFYPISLVRSAKEAVGTEKKDVEVQAAVHHDLQCISYSQYNVT